MVVDRVLSTGVAEILNRLDRKTFNDADQRLFEVGRAVQLCSSHLKFAAALQGYSSLFVSYSFLPSTPLVAGFCDILRTWNQ